MSPKPPAAFESRFLNGTPCTVEAVQKLVHDEGVLLQAPGSAFGDRVFLCMRGRRHWVSSAETIRALGWRWPEDVHTVSDMVLRAFAPAGAVPGFWGEIIDTGPLSSSTSMREAMASTLKGCGLEIGPGAAPFPVPLTCRVLFGDRYDFDTLVVESYSENSLDVVRPDLRVDLDGLDGIADGSLDFLIACHVLEHTPNPIGSIHGAYAKLRPGGKLLLVVPDKNRTFDRNRPITPLEHLVEDFRTPDRSRDFAHYEEFFRLSFPLKEPIRMHATNESYQRGDAIHYHVWDHDAFCAMLDWSQCHARRWSHTWTHPPVGDPAIDNEFYALLTK
jgi:SAM-dependent methyltransferase